MRCTSRKSFAWIAGVGALVAMTSPASAQRDPAACTSTGVALVVNVFTADGTGVVGSVAPCQSLLYRVTLAKASSDPSICAFRGGTLSLRTPDGVDHVIATNLPCVGGTGANGSGCDPALQQITSDFIPYTISTGDVAGGLVRATANYTGGVAMDAPTPTPGLSAQTPRFTPVLASCRDLNFCTRDFCDAVSGCRHLAVSKCLFATGFDFKLKDERSKVAFKRQGGTDEDGSYLKVTLQEVLLTSVGDQLLKQKIKVSAVVRGEDAAAASLLYPVLALGVGDGALAALQGQGYDVTVTGSAESCQSKLSADVCTMLAKHLAQAIDTQLTLGDGAERDAFLQGIEALGYRPDQYCVPPPSCVPTTCEALNANCGAPSDGCDGSLQCGTCTPPLSCGGAGEPNRCGAIF